MSDRERISADQRRRIGFIYIRQSTQDQVQHNKESRLRQYGLKEKAAELGFTDIRVIDEDLGKSASGSVHRPGFEQLLAEVVSGTVGAVFAVEASRLARNGREWHTLLELCGFMHTLIIDHDGIYDPRSANDRLLLGMKGTISEMELSILRQRSEEALKQKAHRGELLMMVAVGYVRAAQDRIEMDPDARVREAVALVFEKFRELGSVRQVLLWFRTWAILLPAVHYRDRERSIVWKLPIYNSVHHVLTNPVYAGAYVFGRTYTKKRFENGRQRVIAGYRRSRTEWPVLILAHHEAYIDWDEYERNQRLIGDNANMKGAMSRGSVKRGEALLAGLLRCGHCGRKLHVAYSGTGGTVVRYGCRGAQVNHGSGRCISLGAVRLEAVVSRAVLKLLTPLSMLGAETAVKHAARETEQLEREKSLELEQARYEASRAERQFNLAEPENRLVTAELERRWNERLLVVRRLEEELARFSPPEPFMNEEERTRLLGYGRQLPMIWDHPQTDVRLKKRILRTVIREIIISIAGETVSLVIHWSGGEHSRMQFRKNRSGIHRWKTDSETEALIRELAEISTDTGIALILNRLGRRTAKGLSWTAMRVATFRNDHLISVYDPQRLLARGKILLEEAAGRIGMKRLRLYKYIRSGRLPAHQACPGAPWVILIEDLQKFVEGGPCASVQQELFSSGKET